ncbi:hypothetical protein GCM10010466_04280 [Planomonospora alba]|uniref:Uncharacterized protein n=1 Tax=Planomonospora alba TaxID=161354 RepID=A0ABP6MMY8_9ACTN
MGKFDGMDPELVRGLLAEVKQAAEQMRTAEGRVTRLMSAAGLSSQSAHRPVRIADECDTMVKDVSARVALLEKRIERDATPAPGAKPAGPQEGTSAKDAPGAGTPKGEEAPKGEEKADDRRNGTSAGEDRKADAPEKDDRKEPDAPGKDDRKEPDAPGRDAPKEADDRKPDAPGKEASKDPEDREVRTPRPETPQGTGDRAPDGSGKDAGDREAGTPRAEDLKPAVPENGGPRDGERSGADPSPAPRDGAGRDATGREDGAGGVRTEGPTRDAPGTAQDTGRDTAQDTGRDTAQDTGRDTGSERKPEADSKGDDRSPRGGDAAPDGNRAPEAVPDTRGKDHPDDIDRDGGIEPRVVEVDGVKVLQIPLDPPSAERIEALLEDIGEIPPVDMPAVDGVSHGADTRPGQVEPNEPLPSARPDGPLLDTAEPADDQTVQPPGTGGDPEGRSTGAPDASSGSRGQDPPGGPDERSRSGGTDGSGTAGNPDRTEGSGGTSDAPAGGSAPRWTSEGDVISVRVELPDLEAIRTLAENARAVEPLEMPGVQVPEGETWGEGAWAPMDVGPDGPAGELDPADPRRPVPPPGGKQA